MSLWKHFIAWLDWHGRIFALVALIIAFGGAALINRLGAIWGSVHGVYLWIVSLLAFGVFLATFEIVVRKNRQVQVTTQTLEGSSPLEIVFDPANPHNRFWSRESPKDEHGLPMPGVFWEHRVEIRNNSMKTLRNVSVTTERIGLMPQRPYDNPLDKNKTTSCDLKPGCSELVPVIRWPIPKAQAGMLAGPSAWGYGPIKLIASADDVAPSVRIFQFNFETDQMLFDEIPPDSIKAVAVPIAATDPRIVMEFETKPLPFNARDEWIGERPVILRNDGGEIAYDVRVEPVIFKHGRAQFATVPTLYLKESTLIRPEILDFPKETTGVSEFEVLVQQAWMVEGDWRQIEKPMRITYRDFGNRRFATDFVLSYDLKSGTSAGAPKFTRLA